MCDDVDSAVSETNSTCFGHLSEFKSKFFYSSCLCFRSVFCLFIIKTDYPVRKINYTICRFPKDEEGLTDES